MVAERAQARTILAVHKAAGGSAKHQQEADYAVRQAADRLDAHHGSASGLMGWNGWGKGYNHSQGAADWQAGPAVSLKQEVEHLKKMMYGGPPNAWESKGKGKGKGDPKGKGKGKTKGKGEANAKGKGKGADQTDWWPCPVPMCRDELNQGTEYLNHPGRECCNLCLAPKVAGICMKETSWADKRAAVREQVAAAAGDGKPAAAPTISKTQAKKLRNAEKKKEHEEKEAAGGAAESEEEPMDEEEEPLPTEKQLADSLKILRDPQPLKEGWTPASVVDDSEAQEASKSLATLRLELAACAKVVKLIDDGVAIAGVDIKVTRSKMVTLEKAITKANKDTPTIAVNAFQLRLDRQVYLDDRTEKLLIVQRGAATAKANFVTARAMHQRMADSWTEKLEQVVDQETNRQQLFKERNDLHEARHLAVVEEYDKRIAAAEEVAKAAKDEAAKGAPPAAETPEEKAEKAELKRKADAAAEGAAEAEKTRLATEQAETDRLNAAQGEARRAFAKMHTTATISRSDLADLNKLKRTSDTTMVMATMYYWYNAGSMGDMNLPFSFAEMGATAAVARELVGDVVWKAFFYQAKVADADVCPMQLRQVVFLQLLTLEASLKEQEHAAQEEVAQKHLEEAGPRLKRLRTMLNAKPDN